MLCSLHCSTTDEYFILKLNAMYELRTDPMKAKKCCRSLHETNGIQGFSHIWKGVNWVV